MIDADEKCFEKNEVMWGKRYAKMITVEQAIKLLQQGNEG